MKIHEYLYIIVSFLLVSILACQQTKPEEKTEKPEHKHIPGQEIIVKTTVAKQTDFNNEFINIKNPASDLVNIENERNINQKTKIEDTEEIIEESLSLKDKEIEYIKKALVKHKGKRKYAAEDLGISERTLYRKIKDYNLEN